MVSDRAGPCPGTEHVQRWKDGWLRGREERLTGPWCRDFQERLTGEVAAEMPGTLEPPSEAQTCGHREARCVWALHRECGEFPGRALCESQGMWS